MLRVAVFYFLLVVFCTSCVSNYVFTLTDKQVAERYKNSSIKPLFNYLTTPTGKLFYATQGDSTKPLLVFIHGAPGHWYSSMHLFNDSTLLQHFYIVTYDRPGFGKSNNGYSISSIDEQTDALAQLITTTNTSKKAVTVVGRSYGTPIAARYAMRYPTTVQKLLLLAPCVDPKKEKYFWFSFANKMGWVNAFMNSDINHTTDEKFNHKKELKRIANDWHYIKAPTYIVQGRKDWIADTANAYFAERQLINATTNLYLLDNTGHNVSYQHRDLIRKLIME